MEQAISFSTIIEARVNFDAEPSSGLPAGSDTPLGLLHVPDENNLVRNRKIAAQASEVRVEVSSTHSSSIAGRS